MGNEGKVFKGKPISETALLRKMERTCTEQSLLIEELELYKAAWNSLLRGVLAEVKQLDRGLGREEII